MLYLTLQRKINSLENKIAALQQKGDCKQDCWIDCACNSAGKEFVRLRWMESGKRKTRVLKPEEVSKIKAAVARGKKLTQLQRQLQQAQTQLQLVIEQIEQLGGKLPD